MPRKYRIIEKTDGNGTSKFYNQRKSWFWGWKNADFWESYGSNGFDTAYDALRYYNANYKKKSTRVVFMMDTDAVKTTQQVYVDNKSSNFFICIYSGHHQCGQGGEFIGEVEINKKQYEQLLKLGVDDFGEICRIRAL